MSKNTKARRYKSTEDKSEDFILLMMGKDDDDGGNDDGGNDDGGNDDGGNDDGGNDDSDGDDDEYQENDSENSSESNVPQKRARSTRTEPRYNLRQRKEQVEVIDKPLIDDTITPPIKIRIARKKSPQLIDEAHAFFATQIDKTSDKERREIFDVLYANCGWIKLTDTYHLVIEKQVSQLRDLIDISEKYDPRFIYDNLDVQRLFSIRRDMDKLNSVIGNQFIKTSILELIIYMLMNPNGDKDFAHTVITGPPGVGKTMIAEYVGLIISGLRKQNVGPRSVTIARKSDLISMYIGATAGQVTKVFNSARGGVLIIDEAYSLGVSKEIGESEASIYNKECIDTMNQLLSEMKDEIVVILIGYKTEIETQIFAWNQGMSRRFPFRFDLKAYTVDELWQIFKDIASRDQWQVTEDSFKIFEESASKFSNNGGDCEILFNKCNIIAMNKQFLKTTTVTKIITPDIMKDGLALFKRDSVAGKMEKNDESWKTLYS